MVCCDELLKAADKMTGCECSPTAFPFACARHGGCEKTEHWHNLCRRRTDYHGLWESGDGPCLNEPGDPLPFTLGLGDIVAWFIFIVTLGKLKMCETCKGRRAWLNRHFPIWPIRLPWTRHAR